LYVIVRFVCDDEAHAKEAGEDVEQALRFVVIERHANVNAYRVDGV